jgi:hypothetical protein
MGLITPEVESYFASLSSRIGEAVEMPFEGTPGFEPRATYCHDNANDWAARDANRKAVRGWYILLLGSGSYMFIAHSVIEEAGRLYDITPSDPRPTKFLTHEGTQDEFDALKIEWSGNPYPFRTELSNESAEIPDPWQQ